MPGTEWRGDFLGFTFNGKHSSEFGIVRTSDSSRFVENITGQKKDITTDVPGADGALYWGSTFQKKEFQISFAFDGITEQQLNNMRNCWDDRQIHELIFDEQPDRIYSAKLTGNATVKHLCFEEDGVRRYRGEGSLVFTTFSPFARGQIISIKSWEGDSYSAECPTGEIIGDVAIDYVIKCPDGSLSEHTLKIIEGEQNLFSFTWLGQDGDYIIFDSQKEAIFTKDGKFINNSSDFPKLQPEHQYVFQYIYSEGSSGYGSPSDVLELKYNYMYL